MLLAPLVRGRKGQHLEIFEQIRKAGQVRVRVNGTVFDLDAAPPLDGRKPHTIEAVVDRIVVRPGSRGRLAESIGLAVKQSGGLVVASSLGPLAHQPEAPAKGHESGTRGQEPSEPTWTDRLFSTLYACPNCQLSLEEVEPRTFSFNSPYGACPACEGLGYRVQFDPDLLIPDRSLSIASGAVAAWRAAKPAASGGAKAATSGRGAKSQGSGVRSQKEAVEAFLEIQKTPLETPLAEMRPAMLDRLFAGDGKEFPGLFVLLEQELATTTDSTRQEQLESFRGQVACSSCGGARLRPEALGVRIAGRNIAEICRLSIGDAREFFSSLLAPPLPLSSSPPLLLDPDLARPIVTEITARLGFLHKVGLDYLTLDRASDTLSGGEMQRVRLATGIGSGLAGICYILDEPSIGLHPRDNQRLIAALRDLLGNDNTVLVVEHDEAMMREADWLIDIGPGAGSHGGLVVAEGTPTEVMHSPASITG
ncbi:MAG: ABC-ATPase UvrA, partial [Pirellulaceae bacterium]|nr:ABC-ATPase UvrA [Pirellulaceae bacterium]